MAHIVYLDVFVAILCIHFEVFGLVVWIIFQNLFDILLMQDRIVLIDAVDRCEIINIYEVKPCFQESIDVILVCKECLLLFMPVGLVWCQNNIVNPVGCRFKPYYFDVRISELLA